ncbi:hypothetical protein C1645_757697 [Glomus cerebriforme]|uniref:Uncharacterized protein n=1 Tax=Glomus cerebriforme TaxID=658196 RepID=A0A397TAX4_9GLOM|nr:hypothetical protein C1645_757697 [Glomus cerebriforme]
MRRYTIVVIDHGEQQEQQAYNWPSCYPILYHNIEAEFTDETTRKLLRRSYFLCKLYVAMLIVHSCADIAIAITAMNVLNILAELIGSAIYLILMPFGDFFGRHLSLYIAFKHNHESSFRYYFIGETIVIIFGLVIVIGFIFSGLRVIHFFKSQLYMYIPGVFIVLFLLIALVLTILHIILTIKVYKIFKSRNFTLFPRRDPNPAITVGGRRIGG